MYIRSGHGRGADSVSDSGNFLARSDAAFCCAGFGAISTGTRAAFLSLPVGR